MKAAGTTGAGFRRAAVWIAGLSLGLAAGGAPAQEAEPSKVFTQDAFTVEPGSWEVGVSAVLERGHQVFDETGSAGTRPQTFQSGVLAGVVHGLGEGLDLSLGFSLAKLADDASGARPGSGLGDIQLELRWMFHRGEGWNLAYLPRLVAPVGDKRDGPRLSPGQPYWSLDHSLVASRVQGPWAASVEGSVSLPFGHYRDDHRRMLTLNGALGYQLTPSLQVEVEWLLEHQRFEQALPGWRSSLALGAVMQLTPGLRMDLGLLQGLAGRRADRLNVLAIAFTAQY